MTGARRPLVAFYGHHRCGSTWVTGLLEAASQLLGLRFARVYDAERVDGGLADFVRRQGVEVLSLMNADAASARALSAARAIHVVRDPRDVLVSAYFSHRNSHPTDEWPELEAHRQALRSVDEGEGILLELECRRLEFRQMMEWRPGLPGHAELRFEDLIASPEAVVDALGALGLVAEGWAGRLQRPLLGRLGLRQVLRPSDRVLGLREARVLVGKHSFARLSGGRQPGVEDRSHHYRRGEPGAWREHLRESHLEALEDHFPSLTAQLGYCDAD